MSQKNSKAGFSVRDILELSDTNDEGSVTEDTEDEADEGLSGNQQRASSRDALWLGSPCGHNYPSTFMHFREMLQAAVLFQYLKIYLIDSNQIKQ